jgi:hypothetical protein
MGGGAVLGFDDILQRVPLTRVRISRKNGSYGSYGSYGQDAGDAKRQRAACPLNRHRSARQPFGEFSG